MNKNRSTVKNRLYGNLQNCTLLVETPNIFNTPPPLHNTHTQTHTHTHTYTTGQQIIAYTFAVGYHCQLHRAKKCQLHQEKQNKTKKNAALKLATKANTPDKASERLCVADLGVEMVYLWGKNLFFQTSQKPC